MSASNPSPIVTEVLRFEDLPAGSRGTRRAIARWSDGTESEALTWYADEILICEGDLIGKTQPTPLRALPQRPRLAPVLIWRSCCQVGVGDRVRLAGVVGGVGFPATGRDVDVAWRSV
jgi:hypothetical protein